MAEIPSVDRDAGDEAATEAERWLDRIGDLCAPIWNNGEDPESQLERLEILMGGLLLWFERHERITIDHFPRDAPPSGVQENKEEDEADGGTPVPGVEFGKSRVEFADGSALVVFDFWIDLGVHASRLTGDGRYMPFLFVEPGELGEPEGRPLPGERMH